MIVRSIAAILSFVLLQWGQIGSYKLSIATDGHSCRQVVVGVRRCCCVVLAAGRCSTSLLLAVGHIDCDCLRDQAAQFPLYKYLLSGAAAGGCRALSRSLTYPLDTIKTYQQTTLDRQHRNEDINYFRGILLSTCSAIPANAVYFVLYTALEQSYACLRSGGGDLSQETALQDPVFTLLRRILLSSIATIPSSLIKGPAELIKQRAQLSPRTKISALVLEAMIGSSSSSSSGSGSWDIKGLFVGSGAQLIRELPFNAFQMAFYEMLRDAAADSHWVGVRVGGLDMNTAGLLGGIAAFMAALLTQPADVLRTKLMLRPISSGERSVEEDSSSSSASSSSNINSSSTLLSAVKGIWEQEGGAGFFRGLVPRLLIVTLGGIVYFYVADVVLEQ